MKLVYLIPWQIDPFAELAQQHPDVDFVRATNEDQLADETRDADIVAIGSRFYTPAYSETVKTQAPKLKWIQTPAIGVETFAANGVPDHVQLTNAAGLKGSTVSEHAFALLLSLRHAVIGMERLREKREWGMEILRHQVQSLEGQTLLAIGYGSIGQEVARKAKAFDMHVVGLNRRGTPAGAADEVVQLSALDTVLPKADVIVVSLPLTAATTGVIGKDQFALMKPSAVVVNIGRGPVIDHIALCDALSNERLGGAALDVFDHEPLPANDPIWGLPNAIVSPHLGGFGGPTYVRFTALMAENLTLFKSGAPLRNLVRAD